MQDEQKELDRAKIIKVAWRNWLLRFIPFLIFYAVATHWLGFDAIFPVIFGILIVTLLYQRFVKMRTWRSIMWGVYASDN